MPHLPHTLAVVLRAVSAIVAAAMLSIPGSAVLRHVHVYADHDHADHNDDHGPAAHAHPVDAGDHHGPAGTSADHVEIEGCDPGQHAVSLRFVSAPPESAHVPALVAVAAVATPPPVAVWSAAALSDVRAHSPPRLTDAPLRAPPLVHPA